MDLNVLVFPGDGIGVEVTREAVRVVDNCAMQLALNPRRFDILSDEGAALAGAIGSVAAIDAVLDSGRVTADLRPAGKPATTSETGDAIIEFL